jgi:uncharacterized protein YjbI with pentapeptide repeats
MNDKPTGAAGAFDVAAWKEELLALNPWARGFTIDENEAAFVAARQKTTLERHAEGKDAWNAWSHGMLALKNVLETAGRWSERGWGEPYGNEETTLWIGLSAAVFSTDLAKHTFDDEATFREMVFPDDASFEGATISADFVGAIFSGNADFRGAIFVSDTAGFGGATFSGDAWFMGATFCADAQFAGATFSSHGGTVWFKGATFSRHAGFESATFCGDADFGGAIFSGTADFGGATFSRHNGIVGFEGSTFSGAAGFTVATFSGDARFAEASFSSTARFEGRTFSFDARFDRVRFIGPGIFSRAKFRGAAVFDESEFRGDANFEGLESTGTFSLASATFHQVPTFTGASFRGLRLDNVQTPRCQPLGWAPDKDAAARFRELKRRANEAQDRDREIEFFAQEIRTSRFHANRLPAYVPRVWEWRFWFGLLFGTFSDFGRSLWRPVLFWFVLLAVSGTFYLGEHEDMKKARAALNPDGVWSTVSAYVQTTFSAYANPPACRPQGKEMFAATDAWAEAVNLALANALVVDTGRGNSSRRTYGCLYGFETAGDQEYARVSSRVSRVSTVQSLASGVLILLFLLAVRNLLRLK